MMEMKEQTGSRKKLLVPVVVLMLCLVTLTGAAYAYSSTMVNTGNVIDANYISIDLKNKGTVSTDIAPGDESIIQFQDHFEYANGSTKTNQVTYTLTDDVVIVTYKLYIDSDLTGSVDLIVSSSNLGNVKLFTVDDTATKLTDKYYVKFTDGTTTKDILLADDASTATADNKISVNVKTDLTIQIIFDLKAAAPAPVALDDRGAVADTGVAKDFHDAFANGTNNVFTLTFTADVPDA